MARCTRTTNLEVHHISRKGGSGINNAQVLCQECHENTPSYGSPGESPEPFSAQVKVLAKVAAGNQCQCNNNSGCH
ncbi:MAG: hypothetical protein KAR57_04120 [Bacteroidales bacterium]|nr:hypothetical protein [Bacteroidales bacterium]